MGPNKLSLIHLARRIPPEDSRFIWNNCSFSRLKCKKIISVMWIKHTMIQLFHCSLAKTLKEMVPWFILMGRKFWILVKMWTPSLLAIQLLIKEHKKKRKDHIFFLMSASYVAWYWVVSGLRDHNHFFFKLPESKILSLELYAFSS